MDCARAPLAARGATVHAAGVAWHKRGETRQDARLDGRTVTLFDSFVPTMDGELVAPVGTVVGDHYRVLGVLGSGGMGVVLRALDEDLEREVAIKLIHAHEPEQGDLRARFRAEARAMARVRHTNVVEIFAFGEHDGVPYFVMEYVPGSDLVSWTRGRRELAEVMLLLDQLCRGVTAIHEAGTLHRDLKPSNILVSPDRRVVVTDLGLAQIVGGAGDPVLARFVGTPAYLAPELARQETIAPALAHRIDVYALGCIAFELLTGRRPHVASGLPALLTEHGHVSAPAPSAVARDLPAVFDAPIARALAKDPAERTDDANTFRREMQAAFEACSPRGEGVDILVVDDDPANLQAMHALLTDVFPAASIRCAGDGRVAAHLALERTPSVVVTDLDMPNHGGLELTAALRSTQATAEVPIIVVTGQGGAKDWKVLHALGADRFLVKPIDPGTLINELRALTSRPG
jgi:eukaryotic-like serine/threonine-protein kinase